MGGFFVARRAYGTALLQLDSHLHDFVGGEPFFDSGFLELGVGR